jgi:hypothetical protein
MHLSAMPSGSYLKTGHDTPPRSYSLYSLFFLYVFFLYFL